MNPYNVDVRESNLMGPLARLKIIYDEMPATSGCEKCSEVNGENVCWCCRTQNPSMYYIEFLHVWKEVQNWSKSRRAELIVRAMRNYLSNSLSKGCVFYTDECLCYQFRPFMCRNYGVISEESWNKRWDQLKDRQKDKFEAKPQCSLVSICDETYKDTAISAEDEDRWFKEIFQCEVRIGVTPTLLLLHDQPGGPYRTFHDHILIELFDPSFLEMMTKVRMSNPSPEDIEKTMEIVSGALQEYGVIK